ncbi:MAG: hypothetical protein AAFR61_23830 [Bacteroidota bacterium]
MISSFDIIFLNPAREIIFSRLEGFHEFLGIDKYSNRAHIPDFEQVTEDLWLVNPSEKEKTLSFLAGKDPRTPRPKLIVLIPVPKEVPITQESLDQAQELMAEFLSSPIGTSVPVWTMKNLREEFIEAFLNGDKQVYQLMSSLAGFELEGWKISIIDEDEPDPWDSI